MHLAFVTDCSSQQRWLAMLLLHSAGRVGQDDPITWVRWGCEAERLNGRKDEEQLLRRVYSRASLFDVDFASSNQPQEKLRDISWIKPFGFQAFLSGPEISNATTVAMLDADFIFLDRLRVDDLAEHSIASLPRRPATGAGPVEGLHGVVQHYRCCDGAGAPYLFTAEAWRELLPGYAALAGEATGAWGEEQQAFATAAARAGVVFSVFDHFMVSDISEREQEGWRWVEEHLEASGGGSCGPPGRAAAGPGAARAPRLPTFLHVVRPWNPEGGNASWQFSKYQVPPGWGRPEGEGILDCDMPLLAEPPTGLVRSASGGTARLSSWALCGIIHSVNDMLADVKGLRCPHGGNLAKVLKIEANWHNSLLPGQSPAAPGGVVAAFVARCALDLNCSRGSALQL